MVTQVLLWLIAQCEWVGKKRGAHEEGANKPYLTVSCSYTP